MMIHLSGKNQYFRDKISTDCFLESSPSKKKKTTSPFIIIYICVYRETNTLFLLLNASPAAKATLRYFRIQN